MEASHSILFSAEQISETVRSLAGAIDGDLGGGSDPLIVVTVLKGAVMFSCDLVRAMASDTEMVFLTASSYSGGFTPGETIQLRHDDDLEVSGRDVLIVDDIIDTGRTLSELAALMLRQRARSVSTAALINKVGRRSVDTEPTYSGIEIGEEFIYGYGLDWDERYRDLPFIAIANP